MVPVQLSPLEKTAMYQLKACNTLALRAGATFDVKACKRDALALCVLPSGRLDVDGFAKKYREQLDDTGKWFMSVGMADWDRFALLGWSPRQILWEVTGLLIVENTSLKRPVYQSILTRPEAAQHFTTWFGYLFAGMWDGLKEDAQTFETLRCHD